LSGVLIGSLDAWQSHYLYVAHYGKEAAIIYESGVMVATVFAADLALHDRNWSAYRNALNLLVAIPIAVISDNVSLDIQTRKLYVLLLPRSGFVWRSGIFGHTVLYPLANWVDLQTLGPGLIDGYVAAIIIGALYILVQIYWTRLTRPSKPLSHKGKTELQQGKYRESNQGMRIRK
jgi:hypothetical protein